MSYGLIGAKLSHSYSKIIHNFWGNAEYRLWEIKPENLDAFFHTADFAGVNVTIPYKEAVMPYCLLSEEAARIGSVNTVVNRQGKLYGGNTDYAGFLYMTQRAGIDFRHKKVLILGSGGTSKTAFCAARDSGAKEIIVVSRKGGDNYQNLERHHNSDILINTTPLGMYPLNSGLPVDISPFGGLTAVIDVIYNPLKTNLLLAAQRNGVNFTNGLSMLVAQAWFSHKLFFDLAGNPAEDGEVIEGALRKTEKFFRNIVLIGMPGCGKTTIGRELACRLGMTFADTDIEIERHTGRSVPEIIETEGEAYFRRVEKDIVLKIARETGQVIATGGGSIMVRENRDALLQNGYILFLDKDITKLATGNRPLAKDFAAISELYNVRVPIYRTLCNKRICVDGNLEENMTKIMEGIQ
ncbi:MAG: hypothetical protein LBV07_01360 [Syntrophobacterales bacterium]|jgi:shikimate dehydrogenase|nr:hypothetical protein [Syntrophobacterales bacterium]